MVKFYHAYCLLLLRRQLRLQQKDMAELLGIKKPRYTNIETGKVLVLESELRHFFDTLNVDYKEYSDIINYIHKEYKRDTGYIPEHPKYFGCLLPIPALQKVTLDLLQVGFKLEEELYKRTTGVQK